VNDHWRTLGSAAAATAVLGLLIGLRPLPIERLLAGYVLALAAIALLALVRNFSHGTKPAQAGRFEEALRGRRRKMALRPPVFIAMEREIELGMEHAGHAHRRLLPLLRAAAAARLAAHHGVEIEDRPDVARSLLGEEAWDFLRADRPEPVDRHGRGLSRDTIAALIERVELL
jgi:hypothetical protein